MTRSTLRTLLATLGISIAIGATIAKADDVIRIGVPSTGPNYAIFYAGNELGFYKQSDLRVEITQFRGGPAVQEALAANSIDICPVLPMAVSWAVQKGVKEHIVALLSPPQAAGWHIMVNSNSPIKSMADMNAKTVGVTQIGSLTDLWVLTAAKSAHVEVNTIALGGGVPAGLNAKQVDAALLWPLYSYKGLSDGTLRSIDDLGQTLPLTIPDGIAASDDLIANKPDVLKRWLVATSKTLIYMQNHEDWAVQFLKKYFDEGDDKVVRLAFYLKKIRADGIMETAWMEESLKLGAARGVTNSLPVEKIFLTKFTPIKSGN
jgi:NitT/TauT family transport system substrate-binding protein